MSLKNKLNFLERGFSLLACLPEGKVSFLKRNEDWGL